MKLKTHTDKITPFGGIHIIDRLFSIHNVSDTIDTHLGVRSDCSYSYSDILRSMFYTVYCGGDCAEDVEHHMFSIFEQLEGFQFGCADTVLNVQRELAGEADWKGGHKIFSNTHLNELCLKLASKTGVFEGSDELTLDFDQVLLSTGKKDARRSYKGERGYFPALASIEGVPVYVEGREGNCPVITGQQSAFQWMFDHFEEYDISVKRCRMDCGSYNKELLNWLDQQDKLFYVRANTSHYLQVQAAHCKGWEEVKMKEEQWEVNSFAFRFGANTFRIVACRQPRVDGQINLHTNDHYRYQFIITNDEDWSAKKIIAFYNQRGAAEKLFDVMNNDFNWRKMPFSSLQYNSVYLCLMAVCMILYQWVINLLSQQYDFLQPYFRLKKFIFRFICVAAKKIRSGRQTIVKLFTQKSYSLDGWDPPSPDTS